MTATDAQVRIIMREREKGRTQKQAAASANCFRIAIGSLPILALA